MIGLGHCLVFRAGLDIHGLVSFPVDPDLVASGCSVMAEASQPEGAAWNSLKRIAAGLPQSTLERIFSLRVNCPNMLELLHAAKQDARFFAQYREQIEIRSKRI